MTVPLKDMPTSWSRALALVAHPDDIEYAMGPAVITWTDSGKEIAYVLASRGESGIDGCPPEAAGPLREREQRASSAVAGVTSVEFLSHPDGLITDSLALRREFAAAIRRHRPDMVLTINHHDDWRGVSWNTSDHRVVGRAALDAVVDAGNRYVFPEDGLEPWEGVRWAAVAGSPYPTHAMRVVGAEDRAVEAVLQHRSYLEALTDEDAESYARGFLRRNMAAAGERFHGHDAVAFQLYERDPYRVRDGVTHYR
ncbi:PIG-L deacetylase family protein [Streptomyces monomycini]|uniref:PIG-L deacetylase family protein n=1 Tax=Streptomyces monomycini TaxID=371720 RepID=UPI00067B0237|nr:PIG-L deacetylase family protein [Streptomyces monomycini]